ncbi:MAG: YciI family protein [bacterium]|nr:YciI family protein [bacterium]
MKEYLLLIRSVGNPVAGFSPEEVQRHVQKVGAYIEGLAKAGKMKSAQPLAMEGAFVAGGNGKAVTDGPFVESKEVIAGYYHILAADLKEAVDIAKNDPRFEDAADWRIEVRPVQVVDGIND